LQFLFENSEKIISQHIYDTPEQISDFSISLAKKQLQHIAYNLVADGSQPEFEKYPSQYLMEAFSHWFGMSISAHATIAARVHQLPDVDAKGWVEGSYAMRVVQSLRQRAQNARALLRG
jgi:hypothetical protein